MAFVPTPNTVKACLRYIQNGQNTCNVFHFDIGHEPTEGDLRDVADMVSTWWQGLLRPLIHPGTSLVAVEVWDVSAENQEGIVSTTGLPVAGAGTGNALPNNATVCVKCATGFTGRTRRGRKYVAGLQHEQLNSDRQTLQSTVWAAIEDAFRELITDAATAGFTWVINSIIEDGVPRLAGLNTPVTDISVNRVLDSQRRRLPERGI